MIKFKKVKYKNFLSTGNIFSEIQLDTHKNTLIIGENGAGKSTVLEAISFALYGKPMRNINKPQLVNSITKKDLMVELEFGIGLKNYLIRRGMKPNIFEIYTDDKLLNQDSAARDYQQILETQILKLNHKSFAQIMVLSVTNYTPFMELPAAGRREVIEDLLDIQIFSVMNILLRDKISTNKLDIQDADYQIKLVTNKIELVKKHHADLKRASIDTINLRKNSIKSYKEENAQLHRDIELQTKEIKSISKQITARKEKVAKLNEAMSRVQFVDEKVGKIRKEIDFYKTNASCPTCKQEITEDHKAHVVGQKTNLLTEAAKTTKKLQDVVSKLQSGIADLEELSLKYDALNKSITEKNTKIISNNGFIQLLFEEIQNLESKIHKAKTDNSEMDKLNEELNIVNSRYQKCIRQRELYTMASQLLKDGGIKTKIIRQYVPIMNKLINKYLTQMDFYVQFELDETFKETIKSRFRDEFTYASFSQGEKLRIDLALLFCWRAIAKLRNSSSSNLLFMDEILDSSLDPSGVEEFLKIIESLTKEANTNTFIISHRGDSVIDKFENIIQFKKEKNFSKIVE
jgi:DNA repair exonuclease SbcCD ATPase subunit